MEALKHSPGPYSIVQSRKQKFKEALFIKCPQGFVGKVYGHESEPVIDNAVLFRQAPNLENLLRRSQKAINWALSALIESGNQRTYLLELILIEIEATWDAMMYEAYTLHKQRDGK